MFLFIKWPFLNWSRQHSITVLLCGNCQFTFPLVASKWHPCCVTHPCLRHCPCPDLLMPLLPFSCSVSSPPDLSLPLMRGCREAHLMADSLHPSLLVFFDMSILFLCCLNLCIPHLKWSHFSVIILKRKYVMLLFSLKFPVMGCHASCSPHVAGLMNLLCVSLCLAEHCSVPVSPGTNLKRVCFIRNGNVSNFQNPSLRLPVFVWSELCIRQAVLW